MADLNDLVNFEAVLIHPLNLSGQGARFSAVPTDLGMRCVINNLLSGPDLFPVPAYPANPLCSTAKFYQTVMSGRIICCFYNGISMTLFS